MVSRGVLHLKDHRALEFSYDLCRPHAALLHARLSLAPQLLQDKPHLPAYMLVIDQDYLKAC